MFNFSLIPSVLAPWFGGEFLAGVFLSLGLFGLVVIPILLFAPGKSKVVAIPAMAMVGMGVISLGWVPPWAMIVAVMGIVSVMMLVGLGKD